MYMKTRNILTITFVFVLLLSLNSIFSAHYNISFSASGSNTVYDSIEVQNISKGITAVVPFGNDLQLNTLTTSLMDYDTKSILIYPNPVITESDLSFYSSSGSLAHMLLLGIDGTVLYSQKHQLEIGLNTFKITLPKGVFIIQIIEKGITHNAKIISKSSGMALIKLTGSNQNITKTRQKVKNDLVTLSYSIGDKLLFKAYSGNYTSIFTDTISVSRAVNFKLIECKDGDGNYYPVVTIGSQIWMAQNLKTSKYRNEEPVGTSSTLNKDLLNEVEPKYEWLYNGNEEYEHDYGRLYTWHTITDARNIAPDGWHIPSDAEWTQLSNFLGSEVAGDKLRSKSLVYWNEPNNTATNETGFSAKAGGTRLPNGIFSSMNDYGYWWTNSEGAFESSATSWLMTHDWSNVARNNNINKKYGLSVRCVLNDTAAASLPIISTAAITGITTSSAISGGNITETGGAAIIARGVCWSSSPNPTIADSKTNEGTTAGVFESTITGLTYGSTYYVKAYVTVAAGTAYGNELTFNTNSIEVSTNNIGSINSYSASAGGSITQYGGSEITSRGVCWSTSQNPTINDDKTIDGTGAGDFASTITGISVNNTYYVRAYAINESGTTYGNQVTFNTNLPALTTTEATEISVSGAISGGNISNAGGTEIISRGVCWSTNENPTIENNHSSSGTGAGEYTVSITGLSIGNTYYVRAYATNSIGVAYGNQVTFSNDIPTLTTTSISDITETSASSGGEITNSGGTAVISRGICWSTSPSPTIGDNKTTNGSGTGTFSTSMTGLTKSETYYVRSYATNSIGTAYGNQLSFKAEILEFTTTELTSISDKEAYSGVTIITGGGYNILSKGVCWSSSQNPTLEDSYTLDGAGSVSVSTKISGLIPSSTYYVRAYVTNTQGTFYGNQLSFVTLPPQSLIIGNYEWMKFNLNVSVFRNGDTIPEAKTAEEWIAAGNNQSPAWCYYNDDPLNGAVYGKLYNWYAVNDSRGLAPDGWNIPTNNDWSTLVTAVGGSTYAGRNLKEAGTAHWSANYGTNSSGFTALPGGWRITDGTFVTLTTQGNWWSSSVYGSDWAYYFYLTSTTVKSYQAYKVRNFGMSVRCLRLMTTPTISTLPVTDIYATYASSGGSISSDGGSDVIARGVCWSTYPNPTIDDSKTTNGDNVGAFTSSMTGLTEETTYYVRAYATNSMGTAYGNEIMFATARPVLTTTAVTNIVSTTTATAQSGGNITDNGGPVIIARGVCWSTSPNPTISDNKSSDGTGNGSFISTLSDMSIGSTYYIRAYATNNIGTSYGNEISLTINLPVIMSVAVTSTAAIRANSGGNISDDGGYSVTARGVCWSTSPRPTTENNITNDGTGVGSFSSLITGLSLNTTYYIRAYATNSTGTAYGEEYSHFTGESVIIGTQEWKIINLAVDTFRNGDAIYHASTVQQWVDAANSGTPAWCYYDGSAENGAVYGKLYNWYAVNDPRGLAPEGWHVSTSLEWDIMAQYLGGPSTAATKLKETGTAHWQSPNVYATNTTFFTALGGGGRYEDGGYNFITQVGFWWTTDESPTSPTTRAILKTMISNDDVLGTSNYPKGDGMSVRCVKD